MKLRSYIVCLGILLAPALCKAGDVCPWINTATILDAPSSSIHEVQSTVINEGNECVFHYREGDLVYNVQITVQPETDGTRGIASHEAPCTSAKTPLNGIGNKAVLCGADAHTVHGEQVIGRVRDWIFIIRIRADTNRYSPAITKILCDKTIITAEQVAGNLF